MLKELARIEKSTNEALDALLRTYAPGTVIAEPEKVGASDRDLAVKRASMAEAHERRVRALISALGPEEAIRIGRDALYQTGLRLGKDARERLGVTDDRKDLMKAARVMYRILGIEFRVVPSSDGYEHAEVTRCALSSHYSKEACMILSAVDEGVVSGLNPHAGMLFEKRITDGFPVCIARLTYTEETG